MGSKTMGQTLGTQVRRLGPNDFYLAAEAIRTVKTLRPDFAVSGDYLKRFLSRSENILIVAAQDGAPIGFLLAYMLDRADRDQKMVCLYEIGVSEAYRQRGFGRVMVEALKTICQQENVMKTWVITNRSNLAAVRLYESTGAASGLSDDELVFVYAQER
jgi:ribosomal protein S18 acetylase RimI-like enzyme